MDLQTLVATPSLKIKVLHGEQGWQTREAGWAYTTDLFNPSRYLSDGQLILTGMMWRRSADDSDPYVQRLAQSGAVALIAGEALWGFVPDDVVQACRRYGLTLMALPAEISFAEITEFIADQASDDRVTRLTASLVRQRQLLAAVASGQALDELVLQASRESGRACWIITSTGRLVVPGSGVMSEDQLDAITAAVLTADRFPVRTAVAQGLVYSVFRVGPATESVNRSWFLLVAGDWTDWQPAVLDAMGELTAIAALDQARREEAIVAWRDIANESVRLIENDGDRPETAMYLSQAGLDLKQPHIVVVADFEGRPDLLPLARWALVDALSELGPPLVGVGVQPHAVALVAVHEGSAGIAASESADLSRTKPVVRESAGTKRPTYDYADVVRTLRRNLRRLRPGIAGARLTVGVSRPSEISSFGGALRSARHARLLGDNSDDSVRVVTSDEVTSAVLLLSSVPDRLREIFADHVLGPVLEYDAKNDAGLIHTLIAFLECSGSWSRAAERLHLHLNTVRYRIAKVETLTNRDLGDIDDRMDIYLAVRML